MKIKAAVVREVRKPYSIEELELEPPKEKEVLVKWVYTGYCCTDLHILSGELPFTPPLVGGHEAAGIVEEIGPGVTKVKKGDHVVGAWMAPCGECPQCRKGWGHLCTGTAGFFGEGTMFDGTSRFKDKHGKMVRHSFFVSAFSTYSVLPEVSAIPIRKYFPLEHACLMGCCISTGWGAVTNTAQVLPGDSVAVFGLGGVGLMTLRASRLRHANPIIAIDKEEGKEDLAREFGATHFLCNSKENPVQKILEITGGGAQFVFEATGDPGAIMQAWWSLGIRGKLIVLGITPFDRTTDLPLFLLPIHEKSVVGSLYGSMCAADIDIPRLVDMAMLHDLKIDRLITNKFKLKDINEVADKMNKRQVRGRWVLEWD